jgi:hypothetical protein
MVLTKAACSQRNRRKREALLKEKEIQRAKQQPPKPAQSQQVETANIDPLLLDLSSDVMLIDDEDKYINNKDIPIIIDEQDSNSINNEEIPIIVDEQESESIFKIYEEDQALVDESQQIVDWCQDKDESEDDETEAAAQILWPIFFSNYRNEKRRTLKSGRSKYRMPVENFSNNSKRLIPRKIPQTTKHNYKMKAIKAVGKNNNCMLNWLQSNKDFPDVASNDECGSDSNDNTNDSDMRNDQ